MSPVSAADPRAAELDQVFAEAMSGPSKPREAAPPPEIDRDAPHGRDDQGAPLAPFGINKDGSIRRSAAGRKPKDDQARTAPAEEPVIEGSVVPPPADYSAGLMECAETFWLAGSVVAKVGPRLPLVGRLVPAQKLAATMTIFDSQRGALAAALNLAAQHDVRARKFAAKLAGSDASWVLTAALMLSPGLAAVAAVWQGDTALAEQQLPGISELAARNNEGLERWFARITDQALAAQAQALAATTEQAA